MAKQCTSYDEHIAYLNLCRLSFVIAQDSDTVEAICNVTDEMVSGTSYSVSFSQKHNDLLKDVTIYHPFQPTTSHSGTVHVRV